MVVVDVLPLRKQPGLADLGGLVTVAGVLADDERCTRIARATEAVEVLTRHQEPILIGTLV